MKKTLFFITLTLIPGIIMAYEPCTFNLINPTILEKGKLELKFQHRFRGKINEEPISTFFGMDNGANISIGVRYIVLPKLELRVSRIWEGKEYLAGIGYSFKTPLSFRIDAEFFSYEEFNLEKDDFERNNGGAGSLSLMSEPFFRITPLVNVGYDSDIKKLGLGFGVAIKIIEPMGIIQRIDAIGEYFPITMNDEYRRSMAFGLRIETYSHHFDFILSNNTHNSARHLMYGTLEEGLRFGFNIKRLL